MPRRTASDERAGVTTQRVSSAPPAWKGTPRFEVVGCLGQGGMGVVYEAFDRERRQRGRPQDAAAISTRQGSTASSRSFAPSRTCSTSTSCISTSSSSGRRPGLLHDGARQGQRLPAVRRAAASSAGRAIRRWRPSSACDRPPNRRRSDRGQPALPRPRSPVQAVEDGARPTLIAPAGAAAAGRGRAGAARGGQAAPRHQAVERPRDRGGPRRPPRLRRRRRSSPGATARVAAERKRWSARRRYMAPEQARSEASDARVRLVQRRRHALRGAGRPAAVHGVGDGRSDAQERDRADAALGLRRRRPRRPRRALHARSCAASLPGGPPGPRSCAALGVGRSPTAVASAPRVPEAPAAFIGREPQLAHAARGVRRPRCEARGRPCGSAAPRAWASRRWSTIPRRARGQRRRPRAARARLRARVRALQGRRQRHRRAEPPPRARGRGGCDGAGPRGRLGRLARLFPVLRRVPGVEPPAVGAGRGPPRHPAPGVRRAARAARVAWSRQPLVIFIDDVQWGDVDSAALLLELMRPPHAPPLLLVMTYRDEEAKTSPFLREMRSRWPAGGRRARRQVGPLDAERRARARDRCCSSPATTSGSGRRRAIARESRGSPFLIEELVRSNRGVAPAPARRPSPSSRSTRWSRAHRSLCRHQRDASSRSWRSSGRPLPVSRRRRGGAGRRPRGRRS